MSKRIYISPERRPKPHGKYWGHDVYETDICYSIAGYMAELLGYNGFDVVVADPDMLITDRASWANKNNIDYYIAVHTNASTDGTKEGTATGTEMLAYQHPEAIKANQYIYDELTALYPSNRGIKNGNEYVENNSTNMVSAYVEIGFHDNGANATWIIENQKEIAVAISKGICKYFGVEYKEEPPNNPSINFDELRALLEANGIESITLK